MGGLGGWIGWVDWVRDCIYSIKGVWEWALRDYN